MTGVYDRHRLQEALLKMDLDHDGKIHIDELRYFIEVYGTEMQEWQMHKIHGIIENSTVGLYEEEGMIVIEKLIQNIWDYG
jgi:Ca2+-binding EF-hand superfamily protein